MVPLQLGALPESDRRAILMEMQHWLVDSKLSRYPEPHRIRIRFTAGHTSCEVVHQILAAAHRAGKERPVAQYLVGASLALRFPDDAIRNDSYSTLDVRSGQPGDFLLGDTVFHVTVSPMPSHYDKCRANVAAGYEVMLLVPQDTLSAIDLYLKKILPGGATVDSIEAFVGRNLDDLSRFTRSERISGFRSLLEMNVPKMTRL